MNAYIPPDVEMVRSLYEEPLSELTSGITYATFSDLLADALEDGYAELHHGAAVEISNNYTPLAGRSPDEIFAAHLGRAAFEQTIDHVIGKGTGEQIDVQFEYAVNSMLAGNIEELQQKLIDQPELANQKSGFAHQATLLHYAASNGIEIWRQVVPTNLLDIVSLLLNHGADPKAKMYVYNDYHDAFSLAATSAHPADANIREDLLELLKS